MKDRWVIKRNDGTYYVQENVWTDDVNRAHVIEYDPHDNRDWERFVKLVPFSPAEPCGCRARHAKMAKDAALSFGKEDQRGTYRALCELARKITDDKG